MGDRTPVASRNPESRKNKAKEGERAGSRMLFMLLYKPNTDLHEAGPLALVSELFHPLSSTPFPPVGWGGQQEPRAQTGGL